MGLKFEPEALTNSVHGALTLIEPIPGRKGQHQQWWCRCECGTEVRRRQDYVLRTENPSCGCRAAWHIVGEGHQTWKGVGKLSGWYFGQLRRQATSRGIEFDITIEYCWELFQRQGGKCALTGLPLVMNGHKQRMNGKKQTASLDRIDSTKGYVPGNIQWIYVTLNRMKNDTPQDEFVALCRLVARTHPNDNGWQPYEDPSQPFDLAA
jgi:hypothetical protein